MRQHRSIKMQFTAITLLCTCIGFTPPSKTQLRAPTRQFAAPDVTATAQAYEALGIAQVLEALTERSATYRGAESFRTLNLANTVEDATRRYDEIRWLLKAERTQDETQFYVLRGHLLGPFLI